MSACHRHYPGRIDGTDSLGAAPPTSTFPTLQLGRLLHYIFRGLLSDLLQHLRQQARCELLAESRKHTITAKLRQIPSLGPIRSALAVALIQTPHSFRSKRQL
jgi:hypothetical protein